MYGVVVWYGCMVCCLYGIWWCMVCCLYGIWWCIVCCLYGIWWCIVCCLYGIWWCIVAIVWMSCGVWCVGVDGVWCMPPNPYSFMFNFENFLLICQSHDIKPLFVVFDDDFGNLTPTLDFITSGQCVWCMHGVYVWCMYVVCIVCMVYV